MSGNGDYFAEWGRARQKCTHFGRFGGIVRSTSRELGILCLYTLSCVAVQADLSGRALHAAVRVTDKGAVPAVPVMLVLPLERGCT